MKISINDKQSLEFYFLMIALGTIQAYRYNCINLNILENLFYRMDMLELINEEQLSLELKEITFQGMALEDVESWVNGIIPTTLLVDTINSIDFECKALLLDPVYRLCFKTFSLFEERNKNSFTINFDSLLSFEYILTIFMLGYTLFLIELDDQFSETYLSFKDNIINKIMSLDYDYSEEFDEVITQFDRIIINDDRLNVKRQKLHLSTININIRDYFSYIKKDEVEVDFDFKKSSELEYHVALSM